MTRTELNKLVFTHDKNRYISHEAAFSALMWKPPSADPLDLPDDTDPVFRPTEDVDSLSGWSVVNDESLLAPTASEADAESDWSLVSGIHTPLSNALDPQPPATTVFHTDFSLRCPICPPTLNKRTFASAKALQEHVSSLAHAPKIFHCPFTFPIDGEALNGSGDTNTRKKKKQKEKYFKTLSGLAMHMENGACKGGVEVFREAMRYVEEEVRKTGFVTVKLLG
ncbi:MAG: hypothetical protein M1813_001822 [Trichoglossum hirsutum]|nr:MAG: hypothetical protein M1813_001822 [Trichoglossum hirsutum]